MAGMPDAIFADPRLAEVYDSLEGEREDLGHYLAIAAEFGARSVLDVGCGTGTFACLLAGRGLEVVAVDPAAASLDVARRKPGAERVRWLHGDATSLPELQVDLATMTANVGQLFLTDEAWMGTLRGIRTALRAGGHLVFEIRDPAREVWRDWNRETTYVRLDVPGAGEVETWLDLTHADGGLVSYRRTYVFAADGARLTSDSSRRFWPRAVIEGFLHAAGYAPAEVRDAPDRPGRELVFVASKP